MRRRPSISTLTDTLCPYTTLCRSHRGDGPWPGAADGAAGRAVRVPAQQVRRRLHRFGEPDREPGRGERRRPHAALGARPRRADRDRARSEEHTSELQSLMRISYAVFCLKKKKKLAHSTSIRA